MKIVVLTRIDHDSLGMAVDLSKQIGDVKIVLLSDAIYMLNGYVNNQPDLKFYALMEDLEKRMGGHPDWVIPIEYGDFIGMIMADGSAIVNL